MSKKATAVIVKAMMDVITDDSVKKVLFGTYSDGTPRSMIDGIHDEVLSPKDREKYHKKKGKKKKKNNKKKKLKIDF